MKPTTEQLDRSLSAALREHGQRVTSQRLVIHRVLRDQNRHLTVEQVLSAVSGRLPGISLPTVYATLELFDELGIVRRVAVGGRAILYDPRAEQHHHLVCRRCGRVDDLDGELDLAPLVRAAGRRGFHADGAELAITGLCRECSASVSSKQ